MTKIIRKSQRSYPLPSNIRDLDCPWPSIIKGRHTRINIFQVGYDADAGDDPTKSSPAISPSNILSKL